jgi:hypothetical protein
MKFVLTRNKGIDLILKLVARYFDVGPLAIVDKKNRKVDLVVCSGPVVVVIPEVEGEYG